MSQSDRKSNEQPPAAGVGESAGSSFVVFNALPSVLTSMIFHAFALVPLALMFVVIDDPSRLSEMVMGPDNKDDVEKIVELEDDLEFTPIEVDPSEVVPTELPPIENKDVVIDDPQDVAADDVDSATAITVQDFNPLSATSMPRNELTAEQGWVTGTGIDGRSSAKTRAKLLRIGDGTPESEAAVARALKWIASRQSQDGGWNFDHNKSIHPQPCPDPGSADQARNGATGVGLLPFLGAGHTHKEGPYRKQVYAALAYLIRNMKVKDNTGSWHEAGGSMYSHGIASIAMCEAYAMTHDKELLAPAQLSLNYIVYAQDPVGGGWRYNPKQAGDTSVVGWQLMALKSGHMAYLQVPQGTVVGAMKFLDSVQTDSGAQYGYTGPAAGRNTTTAVGLLSRMYLGWKHDNPALERGVAILDKAGPSTSDMYYNYYATQVCRHYDGEVWTRWNNRMRDWLVESQEKEGVKAGSWYMAGGHANERGGRLYTTAMATMMLEVYYRHLPIYRKSAAEDDFPL